MERSIWRYAVAEAIELITADQPRKRSPPRRDEEVENYINSMTQGLPVEFEAVVDGDRELPQVRGNQPTGEVSTAPPMPEETAESEDVQPDEEDETTDPHHELHQLAKTQVLEFLDRLEDGTVMVGDRELTYCVACGDPRHTLQEYHF